MTGFEPVRVSSADFKSAVSAYSTTSANITTGKKFTVDSTLRQGQPIHNHMAAPPAVYLVLNHIDGHRNFNLFVLELLHGEIVN